MVAAVEAPFHRCEGRGIVRLRAPCELNVGFFSRNKRGRLWVSLRASISPDSRALLTWVQPLRMVLDTRGRTPARARVLAERGARW